jgi:putative two-component system response regulator
MPKMNGYEALIEIKKNKAYDNIAILAMTTDEEEKKKFYSQGANEFISKPFKVEELELKIYCTLKEKKGIEYKENLTKDVKCMVKKIKSNDIVYTQEEVERSQKDFFLKFISIKTKAYPKERNRIKIISSVVKHFTIKLGYDKDKINNIYYASLIRDIGLCGFLDHREIKDKKKYHQYILMGYQTISNVIETDFIKVSKKVILQYHEFYDGTGIPYGLKKKEISDEANLISIVENFVYLLNKKSYQQQSTHTPEEVFNLLYAESAKKFKPKLLRVFLKYFPEFIQIRKNLLNI